MCWPVTQSWLATFVVGRATVDLKQSRYDATHSPVILREPCGGWRGKTSWNRESVTAPWMKYSIRLALESSNLTATRDLFPPKLHGNHEAPD